MTNKVVIRDNLARLLTTLPTHNSGAPIPETDEQGRAFAPIAQGSTPEEILASTDGWTPIAPTGPDGQIIE